MALHFSYRGKPVNLGRFGAVVKGAILALTEHEAAHVSDDKDFVPLKEGEVPTPSADELAAEATEAETAIQELRGMTREQLLSHCEQIAAIDARFVFQKRWTHLQLFRAVIARMNGQSRNPGPAEAINGLMEDFGKQLAKPAAPAAPVAADKTIAPAKAATDPVAAVDPAK